MQHSHVTMMHTLLRKQLLCPLQQQTVQQVHAAGTLTCGCARLAFASSTLSRQAKAQAQASQVAVCKI
jgi:hypothetical protein